MFEIKSILNSGPHEIGEEISHLLQTMQATQEATFLATNYPDELKEKLGINNMPEEKRTLMLAIIDLYASLDISLRKKMMFTDFMNLIGEGIAPRLSS